VRVLHAADFGGVAAGGFVPMIAALARRLAERGDAFALVVPRVDGATWHPLIREAGGELHVVEDAPEAARFARAWRPDVAHVHFSGWEIGVTRALWTSRTRLFWHMHSSFSSRRDPSPAVRDFLKYRLAGARVERFVAVSDAIRNELVARGAPVAKIVTIRNAVDAARFRPPAAAERDAARRSLQLRDDDRAVLFFGRDPAVKGADVLAAALARLPPLTVVTVATPHEAREALAAHARVIDVERVDDVVPLLWACDALAMPSRAEGFGLVLLEAALSALPAVASDLPALREAADGRSGVRFFAAADDAALAAGLQEALRIPRPCISAMSTTARTTDDSLESWAEAVLALYAARAARGAA
jgi:glycosyltransferase involved in cell wall biosynthesis